jgi:hypothetical protein
MFAGGMDGCLNRDVRANAGGFDGPEEGNFIRIVDQLDQEYDNHPEYRVISR